jgi:hypothetical protein
MPYKKGVCINNYIFAQLLNFYTRRHLIYYD